MADLEKYHCPECGWIGYEDDLLYEDHPNFYLCPNCKSGNYLEDYHG